MQGMPLMVCLTCCRDGGIDATIDHAQGFMSSKEVTDIYSTEEPQSAFHARVAFCLDIHNEVSLLTLAELLLPETNKQTLLPWILSLSMSVANC